MKRSILALVPLALAACLAAGPSAAQTGSTLAAPKKPASATKTKAAPAPAVTAPAATTPGTESATPGATSSPVGTTSTPAPGMPTSTEPAKPAGVDSLGLLERAVKRDSTKFDNLYRLGVMYLDRDRVTEAMTVLLKAHRLRPKNHRVLVNLGAAFDAAGQPATAQTYYKEALAAAPGDSVATCRLASSLYAQANYKDAMKLLRSMIGDPKKNTGAYCAYFTLGVAFADAGIYRDAIRMWKKVIEIAPNSAEANSAKESIDVLEKFVKQ